MSNRAALRNETALLAAEAVAVGCVIAVPAFHADWQTRALEVQTLTFYRDQVRESVDLAKGKKQRRGWDVAEVAAELGVAEAFVIEMFRAKPVPVVKRLALEAAYGEKPDSDDARRRLGLKPEPKTASDKAKDKDKADDDNLDSVELGIALAAGWKALATFTSGLLFGAPAGGRAGRRARLRGMQAEIETAPRYAMAAPAAATMDY